ncbi:MAG: deoxycytidylate deaminase [Alphaproteobacteria bacterium CG_4_9_14_3_um_filter_47_13]|nr:MAG: deoxycytidylate deaminase [Alphaproteobacteria bacterium CG_4_9_14_3_um_filter_47_13]
MNFSSFDEMQKAVVIVGSSLHPLNKIAATIFGTDKERHPYSLSKTNFWPEAIKKTIGLDKKIGNSSGTIHAETAAILAAPYTYGASLCVTDPFCPNCAKNIAEAGIRTIYIDHKGFNKDFAERRGTHFTNMSMQICERAGINVYELNRKEKKLSPIIEIPESFTPPEDSPVEIERVSGANEDVFRALIALKLETHKGRKFAVALAKNKRGDIFGLTARAHPAIGYRMDTDIEEITHPEGKYSFMQEPVNRLLMNAPRHGLKIVNGLFFCSQLPTAREQVNMVGAGFSEVLVRNISQARDDWAFHAMKQLMKAEILMFGEY